MSDYTVIDGQEVANTLVPWFKAMDAEFYARTGERLIISSGRRSYEKQKSIFLSRYVTAGNIRGRYVYDTRWWNGQLWYRISSAGTVAQPGTSLHEKNSALDVRDTGGDPGVTRAGTYRSNVLKEIAPKYGFDTTGLRLYGEPWHLDFVGVPASPAPSSAGRVTPIQNISPEEYPDMFIAVLNNKDWFLVVPQGSAKPRAVILGGESQAASSGLPIIHFTWGPAIAALKQAVTF